MVVKVKRFLKNKKKKIMENFLKIQQVKKLKNLREVKKINRQVARKLKNPKNWLFKENSHILTIWRLKKVLEDNQLENQLENKVPWLKFLFLRVNKDLWIKSLNLN